MIGAICQPVRAGSKVHRGRHDQLFADGINRGIGHLRKKLPKILVEEAGLAGENRQGGIVTHRSGGLFAFLDHGKKDHLEFLVAVAKGKHRRIQIGGNGRELRGGRRKRTEARLHPFAVGLGRSGKVFDVGVPEKFFIHGIDRNHFPRGEAALFGDGFFGNVADSDF